MKILLKRLNLSGASQRGGRCAFLTWFYGCLSNVVAPRRSVATNACSSSTSLLRSSQVTGVRIIYDGDKLQALASFPACCSQGGSLRHSGLTACCRVTASLSWPQRLKAGVSFPSRLFGIGWVRSVSGPHSSGWTCCWPPWTVTPPSSVCTSSNLIT